MTKVILDDENRFCIKDNTEDIKAIQQKQADEIWEFFELKIRKVIREELEKIKDE